MYQSFSVGESERDEFNSFVCQAPKPHFLQSYEWGELKSGTGWSPLRLLVKREGDPIAAISILKRSIPVVNRSIFYAPRGPIIGVNCDQAGEEFFWQAVRQLGKKHHAIFLKIDPDISVNKQDYVDNILRQGFCPGGNQAGFGGVQPRYVFRLEITPGEEQLLAAMESKTRYNIRLAARKGVTIRMAENEADLEIFYRILTETAERDKFLIRKYSYFQEMWRLFVERGTARIFMAEFEGQVIAGTLAFQCGEVAWYLYGASSNNCRQVMPNNLVQWTMIQWAKSLGCKVYDFRGVPCGDDPSNPLYGLYRFKKGFAAEFTEFVGEFDLIFSPFWYQLWTRVLPQYLSFTHRHANKQEEDI